MGIANITNNILVDSGLIAGSANGLATLDSGGKIPASQLPNSVMEFKGVWSAATNTPTLANGTGNAGDVYEVAAAGSVDFGAGPISFSVGDYVVYDGSQWQFSSGQKGTITSLAFSAPLTGGTITTSGTVGITQASGSTDGYLSSTDWTTFNNKQNAITNPITGTGTTGQVAYFNGTTSITSESNLFWDATNDRLGIGTTSPAYNLHLVSSSTSVAAFRNSAAAIGQILVGNTVSDLAIRILASGDSLIFSDTGKYLAFGSNGATERMRLDSSGNLGIGMTPSYRLDITSPSGTWEAARLTAGGNHPVLMRFVGGGGGSVDFGSDSAASVGIIRTGGNERVRIDANGNLGLGVTPSAWSASYKALQIGNSLAFLGASAAADIYFNAFFDGTNFKYISSTSASLYSLSGGQHRFYNAPVGTAGNNITFTQAMTLAATGNLLVGTTTDGGQKLQVQGTSLLNGALSGTTATFNFGNFAGAGARFQYNSSNTPFVINALNNNGSAYIGWNVSAKSSVDTGTYILSQAATKIEGDAGSIRFYNAASGTAGADITFTERMRLDATGNVGIGTTSPLSQLDVRGSGGATGVTLTLSNGGGISLLNDPLGIINFYSNDPSTSSSGIFGKISVNNEFNGSWDGTVGRVATYMAFSTTSNATLSERMRITSGGNLLVGTTTDVGSKVSIQANTSGNAIWMINDATLNYSQTYYGGTASSGFQFIRADGRSGGYIAFGTQDTERIRIANNGNLLIGTTTDGGQMLQVSGSANVTGKLTASLPLSNTIGSFAISMNGDYTGFRTGVDGSFNIDVYKTGTGYINPFKIFETGAATFSSGVTAASLLLTTASFVLKSVAANTYGFTIFNDSATDIVSLTNYYSSSLTFGTTNTERMRITSGGNLLIGTTTDGGQKLQVNGNGYFTGSVTAETNNGTIIISPTGWRDPLRASILLRTKTNDAAELDFQNTISGLNYGWQISSRESTTPSLIFFSNINGTFSSRLTLTSTGAATFSSSVTATSFIKSGGTASQILAADGSVITAGTNITISGGTISSTGGGGSSSIGGAVTGGTTGSILFIDPTATLAQDNANLFWDNSNNRLGIGTATPASAIHVVGSNTAASGVARGNYLQPTLVASANGDNLIGLEVSPTFTNGAFTGVANLAARFQANVVVARNTTTEAGYLEIRNNQTGTAAQSYLWVSSDAVAGSGFVGKKSGTFTTSGITVASDMFIQNTTKGDIAILNSFATGTIKFAAGGSSTAQATLTAAGRLLLGTTTESTYRLDVNGTGRYSDSLLISKNQNSSTRIEISNTTSGASSEARLFVTSDATAGTISLLKYSGTTTAYKIIAAKDGAIYNATAGGDIAILNDTATGTIKFAAGASTTAQLTIAANGNITQSVNQNGATALTVSNTTSGTASTSQLNITSDASTGTAAFGKYSTTTTAAKIINPKDAFLYNGTIGGDISILNDFATGTIKFAAGGSSTAQAVIKTTGQLQLNNYTSASSFTGTAVARLGVDASGNVITTSSSSLTTLDVYLIKETYK